MTDIAPALHAVAPHADPAVWVPILSNRMQSARIATPRQIAMFLGQCAAETGFAHFVEDLYYLTAEHIREVWPTHFESVADAAPYIAEPEKLANHVYANRNGNGDEASGDGWQFRGRGLIQITGRTLYHDFALCHGEDIDEAAVWAETPDGAVAAAVWFWSWGWHGTLNTLADQWDIREVTRRINGGLTDIQARTTLCNRALAALAEPGTGARKSPSNPQPTAEKPTSVPSQELTSADALMAAEQTALAAGQPFQPAPAGSPAEA